MTADASRARGVAAAGACSSRGTPKAPLGAKADVMAEGRFPAAAAAGTGTGPRSWTAAVSGPGSTLGSLAIAVCGGSRPSSAQASGAKWTDNLSCGFSPPSRGT